MLRLLAMVSTIVPYEVRFSKPRYPSIIVVSRPWFSLNIISRDGSNFHK